MPPSGGLAGTLPTNRTTDGFLDGRLGEGAFHAVDHRFQGDDAGQGVAALAVDVAHGRADLVVGERGDIFHQEVHQATFALQDPEDLQRAVGCAGGRGALEEAAQRRPI